MLKFLLNGGSRFCYAPDDGEGGGGGGGQGGQQQGGQQQGQQEQQGQQKQGGDGQGGQQGQQQGGQGDGGAGDAGAGDEGGQGDAAGADWRKAMAGDDEKALATLNRYASQKDFFKAHLALRQKLGEVKAPLPKDATPEQVAAWRKDNGIPDAPDGYMQGLPEGLVFGEADKAALDPFLADMHKLNAPPALVQSALGSYQRAIELQNQRIEQADADMQAATEDELRLEWQGDYRANMAAIDSLLDSQFPEAAKAALLNARDAEMKPVMHNPDVLRALAQLGRQMAPNGTTFGSTPDNIDTIETEIATLKKRMGTKEWYKDEKSQARYRELVSARDRIKKRA